jgi:hypothetical protein
MWAASQRSRSRTPTPPTLLLGVCTTTAAALRRGSADGGPEERVVALVSFDGEVHKPADVGVGASAAAAAAAAASEGGGRPEDFRLSFDGDDEPAAAPSGWRQLHSTDGGDSSGRRLNKGGRRNATTAHHHRGSSTGLAAALAKLASTSLVDVGKAVNGSSGAKLMRRRSSDD